MAVAHSELVFDYVIFFVFIIGSTIWPLWTRKKLPQTKANYVFAAGGGISTGAMLMSLARGTLGVRTFLGSPSELFYKGSAMWEIVYGMALGFPLVSILFIPVYYPLGITSIYQYLDLRFNSKAVRCLASVTYIFRQVLVLGTSIFTPCVALYTIIGVPYWASIIGLTGISVLFTIFGGLKAAIKADVIQGLAMIFISFAIIIQCCLEVNGVTPIVTVPYERDRLKFFRFTGDPTVRVDTTSALLGQLFMSLSIYGCQQNFVQRYCSMDTEKHVKRTLKLVIPVLVGLFSLSWICGMGIFATYADCDPLTTGYIQKMDEILPFFIEDKFTYLPGMMGLFLGSIFNGALSVSVSNINSVATVTYEDFLSHTPTFSKLKDHQQVITIKILGAIYGVVIMGISFGVGMLSGVMESGILMTSATSGPLLGVFILAIFIPCANWKGAIAGMLTSHMVIIWITVGHFMYATGKTQMLPLSTIGCTNETFSDQITKPGYQWPIPYPPLEVNKNTTHFLKYFEKFNVTKVVPDNVDTFPLKPLYLMTYMYYALLGTFVTIIIGVIISVIFKNDESDKYEEKLLHPVVRKLINKYPKVLGKYTYKENEANGKEIVVPSGSKEVDNPAFEMCDNFNNHRSETILNSQGDSLNNCSTHIVITDTTELHKRENVNKENKNIYDLGNNSSKVI